MQPVRGPRSPKGSHSYPIEAGWMGEQWVADKRERFPLEHPFNDAPLATPVHDPSRVEDTRPHHAASWQAEPYTYDWGLVGPGVREHPSSVTSWQGPHCERPKFAVYKSSGEPRSYLYHDAPTSGLPSAPSAPYPHSPAYVVPSEASPTAPSTSTYQVGWDDHQARERPPQPVVDPLGWEEYDTTIAQRSYSLPGGDETGPKELDADAPVAPRHRKEHRRVGGQNTNGRPRPYSCEICQDTNFARPSALSVHMLTHTKERPHRCTECNRSFSVASNLKRHQKLHLLNRSIGPENLSSMNKTQEPRRSERPVPGRRKERNDSEMM